MRDSRPNRGAAVLAVLALFAGAAAAAAAPVPASPVDIPYQKFVLDNGLTLLVHEDHKAPIVAFNIWYHVGSKNEKPGRTGFAHLFEHLMFNGSENYNDDYFKVLERVGATDLNGTTNEDRTNYFENVPTSALDVALWMESDRMGHLVGAIDQARLDEQVGVVQNEKRQYENEPYSLAEEAMAKSCFPALHPYSWTVIGSLEDLAAAKLEDVREWFRSYYGPSNAVVVIAGDIDAQTAKAKIDKYFGSIPPGPPVVRHQAWVAKRSGTQRQVAQDRVQLARLYKVWNIPEWSALDTDRLKLVADVLSTGKTSRLFKRLVYDDQIATSVSATLDSREIAGLFVIQADAKPGVELSRVETAIDEELARLLRDGPTDDEVKRAVTGRVSAFVRGAERIGGFGGKSDILATGAVFAGDPAFYKVSQARMQGASAADLKAAANRWLADGVYVLEIHPFPELAADGKDVDRSKLPVPGAPPAAGFPPLKRAKLSNGLGLVVAEMHSVPLIGVSLLVDAGYAADQFAVPGTASLAMTMLDEGTRTRTSLEISDQLAALGAKLGTGSDLDTSYVNLSSLKSNLDASLDLFADVILNPSFPEADFERLKKQQLATILQEKASPFQMAVRVVPRLLYGEGHAYGNPFTGSGFEATVAKLARADAVRFHETWFKPGNSTVVVVGDTTLDEIRPRIEARFKDWKEGPVPRKDVRQVRPAEKPSVYVMDKPGAPQSVVIAVQLAPPRANPDEVAIQTMNYVLGSTFTSRLNMNIREDKHWSYGAGSFLIDARAQRPFLAFAPVQADKTKETMAEIDGEIRGIVGAKPVTADELSRAKEGQTLGLPGSWETMGAVGGNVGEIVRFGLPDDYFSTFGARVSALTLDQVSGSARKLLRPDGLAWLVVGDRAKIEPKIRELGWGEIRLVDTDGNRIGGSKD